MAAILFFALSSGLSARQIPATFCTFFRSHIHSAWQCNHSYSVRASKRPSGEILLGLSGFIRYEMDWAVKCLLHYR